jgi:hypothetical protein
MSNQTQPKTIADLDALQKSLNPAHLDRLPLETLALACAYSAGSYPGARRVLRDCAVAATCALRDKLAKYPHRRRDYCDVRDDADHAVRHALRAMVAAATMGGAE